jgi:2-oxoglutarate dehydrogenase E2 component (dihydrolipoamide succinyltransferase)
MKQDMVMPKMGESITEGSIIKWLKKVGDTISKDEIILEISTDKVDSEIPTPVAGTLVEILANEGDNVDVGNTIARIETEAVDAPAVDKSEEVKEEATAPEPESASAPVESAPEPVTAVAEQKPAPSAIDSNRFYSPVVLNIARTEGISSQELDQVPGSGISGRVTKKDVLKYLETRGAAAPTATPATTSASAAPSIPASAGSDGIEVIAMDHIRKKIAEHMVHTAHTSPHVGLYIDVDMSNVSTIRDRNKNEFLRKEGIKLTFMPFISEAVARTLRELPYVNSSIDGDNILVKHFVNLGIAVATEKGLIVPVIKNADSLNLTGLARAINDLATRTRDRKLKPDEVSGGTFSISNFGVYGTKIGFPLINQPQVAILGVGALKKQTVVINDAIAIRPIMSISLMFDHRLIDGALGAQFLQRVAQNLEAYDPNLTL